MENRIYNPFENRVKWGNTNLSIDINSLEIDLGIDRKELLKRFLEIGFFAYQESIIPPLSVRIKYTNGEVDLDALDRLGEKITEEREDNGIRVPDERLFRLKNHRTVKSHETTRLSEKENKNLNDIAYHFRVSRQRALQGVYAFGVEVLNLERKGEAQLFLRDNMGEAKFSFIDPKAIVIENLS